MRVGEKAPTAPVDWGNRDSKNQNLPSDIGLSGQDRKLFGTRSVEAITFPPPKAPRNWFGESTFKEQCIMTLNCIADVIVGILEAIWSSVTAVPRKIFKLKDFFDD